MGLPQGIALLEFLEIDEESVLQRLDALHQSTTEAKMPIG